MTLSFVLTAFFVLLGFPAGILYLQLASLRRWPSDEQKRFLRLVKGLCFIYISTAVLFGALGIIPQGDFLLVLVGPVLIVLMSAVLAYAIVESKTIQ